MALEAWALVMVVTVTDTHRPASVCAGDMSSLEKLKAPNTLKSISYNTLYFPGSSVIAVSSMLKNDGFSL